MEQLRVKGVYLDVDYPEELEPYLHQFNRMQVRGEKLQACSPFRNESHPSFAVNLDSGLWVDSGASDEHMRKGNFISLLAYLQEVDYESAEGYLLEKYSHNLDEVSGLTLSLSLTMGEVSVTKLDSYSDKLNIYSPYLAGRGISKGVQEAFEIGESKGAVAIAWHDKAGRIINIKFRATNNKEFWFASGGEPIKNHVYGLWLAKRNKVTSLWVVESEIDCLYLWEHGIPAVAFGGASINERQKRLIENLGLESLIIATDSDTVGERFAEVLAVEFGGELDCYRVQFPQGRKDINDLSPQELAVAKETTRAIYPKLGISCN